jgi:hypothetical protein
MVGHTLPYKPIRKLVPNEELPSIPPPEEIDKPQTPAEQLRHAHEQQALEKAYPNRIPGSLLPHK